MENLTKEDIKLIRNGLQLLRNNKDLMPGFAMTALSSLAMSNEGNEDKIKKDIDKMMEKHEEKHESLGNQIVILEGKLIKMIAEIEVGDALSTKK